MPFFAGTYFPPDSRMGMPSWRSVLEAVAKAWDERREEIRGRRRAGSPSACAAARCCSPRRSRPRPERRSTRRWRRCARSYDPRNGGFGGAPKFPPASALEFLLRRGETEMSAHTLRAMASGGMYDQVGGGFARYSVDPYWLVPHFEKMLYDNALLARAYLHGWQVTGEPLFRTVTEETLDWALREMRGPEGGFYSALDADSEGEEGKFYVWTRRGAARGARGRARRRRGDRVVRRHRPRQLRGREHPGARPGRAGAARRLAASGCTTCAPQRVWPGLDDKRLTSWNALMISALADAGAVLERDDYLDAARGGRRVRAARPARRRRPAAAHLEGRARPS